MSIIRFDSWGGENGIEQFIKDQTGCKPYSGAGINPRPRDHTTLLKSVDDTYYYDDDLSNSEHVKYTLFGHNGDQDVNEKKFNEPFLNKDKTTHIYLYRVKPHGNKKTNICGMVNTSSLVCTTKFILVKIILIVKLLLFH